MSYLLGSPAPRTAIFLGRGLFHILDSFLTVAVALLVATAIFGFRFCGHELPAGPAVRLHHGLYNQRAGLPDRQHLAGQPRWLDDHLDAQPVLVHPGGSQLPGHLAAGLDPAGLICPADDTRYPGRTRSLWLGQVGGMCLACWQARSRSVSLISPSGTGCFAIWNAKAWSAGFWIMYKSWP